MDKRSKIILGIFIIVLIGILVTEIVRPKPLNWKPSYTSTDKIPFGCYVLYHELESLFPGQKIHSNNKSLYKFLADRDAAQTSNYMLINDFLDLDQQEANQLLEYVNEGNETFISASGFGDYLSDTLNLKLETLYTVKEDTVTIHLVNHLFGQKKHTLTRGTYNTHFTSVDTSNTTLLGYISYKGDNGLLESGPDQKNIKPNFIKVKFGEGHFYLNSTPQIFTNYYMLRGNEDYVANSLSYLKETDVYWDDYKKSGRIVIDSPMRFVLNETSLKWAYYLSVVGILIFIVFKAKREQRIVPVIEPLGNSSIEFAKTIGGLYYEHKDFTDLIFKKTNFFLEHLRSHYHINTEGMDQQTASHLSARSGKPLSETKALLDLIIHLKNQKQHSEQDLILLNKKLNQFKK